VRTRDNRGVTRLFFFYVHARLNNIALISVDTDLGWWFRRDFRLLAPSSLRRHRCHPTLARERTVIDRAVHACTPPTVRYAQRFIYIRHVGDNVSHVETTARRPFAGIKRVHIRFRAVTAVRIQNETVRFGHRRFTACKQIRMPGFDSTITRVPKRDAFNGHGEFSTVRHVPPGIVLNARCRKVSNDVFTRYGRFFVTKRYATTMAIG